MNPIRRLLVASLVQWLPLALLTVLLAGMVYLAVQQDYRSSANDPQTQMATDARNALEQGATPRQVTPAQTVDLAQSLAPYLIVYDGAGNVVASSARLHGQTPPLPPGVLDSAHRQSPDTLTWQPEPGVRSAIVVLPYADGYVLAGRSLQVIERREDALTQQVGAACVATLLLTLLATLVMQGLALRLRSGAGAL